jgi:uncharacterized protein Yka (UPF0111/DUF47 family)
MSKIDEKVEELPCPGGCGKKIKISFRAMCNTRVAKCSCGSMYKFKSGDVNNLKTLLQKVEQAEKDAEKAMRESMIKMQTSYINMVKSADIEMKRR